MKCLDRLGSIGMSFFNAFFGLTGLYHVHPVYPVKIFSLVNCYNIYKMDISYSLQKLKQYIENEGFKGYDPYDALNSPILKGLSSRSKILRIAFIQSVGSNLSF